MGQARTEALAGDEEDAGRERILILDAGLYPDREALEAALAGLNPLCDMQRMEIAPGKMDALAWDGVVREILAARKTIVL